MRYEDQWGRRIYPKGNGGGSTGGKSKEEFRFNLWPVKEDAMGENAIGGGQAAVPGGSMTLREQRLRVRGNRRRR